MPTLQISEDSMTASLHLGPGERVDTEAVRALLRAKGVVHGVLNEPLARIAEQVGPVEVVIARGSPPIDGQDGAIEYRFPSGPRELRPSIGEDGRADYRNLGAIARVEAGQLLARRVPPQPGREGRGVRGEALAARAPRDFRLRAGGGVTLSEDGSSAYAARSGHPACKGNLIIVHAAYQVAGDVSLATGNLDFEGDLDIAGHVQRQMSVRATGSIHVHGSVEGAQIVAGGDLTVDEGVRHQSRLEAGGNVVAQYVENSQVRCGGSFSVREDVVQSEIDAGFAIVVGGNVIGGRVCAQESVEANAFGGRLGAATDVQALPREETLAELRALERERAEVLANLERITPRLREAREQIAAGGAGAVNHDACRRLIALAGTLAQREAGLSDRILELRQTLPRHRPRMLTRAGIYPGVRLRLDQAFRRVDAFVPAGGLMAVDGAIRTIGL